MESHIQGFEVLVHNMLLSLGFDVIAQPQMHYPFIPDFIINQGSLSAFVDVKAYRSGRVSGAMIYTAALQLASNYKEHSLTPGNDQLILICSAIVAEGMKEKIHSETGVVVWDRKNIAAFTEDLPDASFDLFFHYFLSNQSGTITEPSLPYQTLGIEKNPLLYFSCIHEKIEVQEPVKKGEELRKALEKIEPGRATWGKFEDVGEEILKYVFSEDISIWKRQPSTDDGLSRFDLIGRIIAGDDFWKTIVSAFNSRYVVFEFKNYKEGILHHQIYTTERYLFPKALRGTAIIIARNGATNQARVAAVGALRETGKLIIVLDDSDLKTMLSMKDQGDSPSDHLSLKLDDILMTLSR